MGYGRTIFLMVITSAATLAIHYAWFRKPEIDRLVERRLEQTDIIRVPEGRVYVEVKCDAFDVYMIPHDDPSLSDADEAGEEYAKDVRCRDVVD